jgi:hypothetical protein
MLNLIEFRSVVSEINRSEGQTLHSNCEHTLPTSCKDSYTKTADPGSLAKVCITLGSGVRFMFKSYIRGCIQKFPDCPPGARTENGKTLCH